MNILIVEDDESIVALLRLVLTGRGHDVVSVGTIDGGWDQFSTGKFEIIILDLNLPDGCGLDLCNRIRHQVSGEAPIILIYTSKDTPGLLTEILDSGADDYIPKNTSMDHIMIRFIIAERQAEDRRKRLEAEDALRFRANHDVLSGVYNRNYFLERAARNVAHAARTGEAFTLAMIDIDYFKQVNDTYGHLSGDQVIHSLGGVLLSELRPLDFCGRYGGDEFAIGFPATTLENSLDPLKRICKLVSELKFPAARDSSSVFTVSLTCGVAQTSQEPITLEKLIDAADKRLYEAKESGRNRIGS